MSDVVFGKDFIVQSALPESLGYTTIGCAVSGTFAFENELIGKTDRNAPLFRKRRARISDCRASINGLITLANDAQKMSVMYFLEEGVRRTEVPLRFFLTDEGGATLYITGNFLIQSIELRGDVSGFGEYDMQLLGTGGVNIDEASSVIGGSSEDFSDWWVTTAGADNIAGAGEGGLSFAGDEILAVAREGVIYHYTSGTPGNMQYSYDGTIISFNPAMPFNDGERVFVMWKES